MWVSKEKANEKITTLEQELIAVHVYMYVILCGFMYVCIGGKLKDLFSRSQSWKMGKVFSDAFTTFPMTYICQPLLC